MLYFAVQCRFFAEKKKKVKKWYNGRVVKGRGKRMIKICLCDDEPVWLKTISDYIKDYFIRHRDVDYSLDCFTDAMSLIDHMEKKDTFDLYLLDVYMPLTLGTEFARELRDKGDESRIVFITTSKNHAIDAFAVRASDYILKPFGQERIDKLMNDVLPQLETPENRYFTVKTNAGYVNVQYNNISFIELDSRRLKVHTIDGEVVSSIIIRGKFEDEIINLANDSLFCHCQKSYLVNMRYVKKMEASQFVMKSDDIVPISKRFYQETKHKYMEYLLRKEI